MIKLKDNIKEEKLMLKLKKLLCIAVSVLMLISCFAPLCMAESDVYAGVIEAFGAQNLDVDYDINRITLLNEVYLDKNVDFPDGTVFDGNYHTIYYPSEYCINLLGNAQFFNTIISVNPGAAVANSAVFVNGDDSVVEFYASSINSGENNCFAITADGVRLTLSETNLSGYSAFVVSGDCDIALNNWSNAFSYNQRSLLDQNHTGVIRVTDSCDVTITGNGSITAGGDNCALVKIDGETNQSAVKLGGELSLRDELTQNDIDNLDDCSVDGYLKKADGSRVYKKYLAELIISAEDGDTVVVADDVKLLADGYQTTHFSSDKNITLDLRGNSIGSISTDGDNTITIINSDSCKAAFGASGELGNVKVEFGVFAEDVSKYIDTDQYYNKQTGAVYPAALSKAIQDGVINLPAAKPQTTDDVYSIVSWYLSTFRTDKYELMCTNVDENDKVSIGAYDRNTYELVVEYSDVEIKFANVDTDVLAAVKEYSSKVEEWQTFNLTDLEVINYWLSSYSSGNEMSPVQNLANYSGELKEFLNSSNITVSFETATGMGWGDMLETGALGEGAFIYDGVAYDVIGPFGAYAKHVIYVDDNTATTKEALAAAAQKRINNYLGNTDVTVEYGGLFEDIYEDCFYVEDWEDFDLSAVEYYFTVTIGENQQHVLIVPDSSKMVTPSYKTADVVTNIEISSASAEIPLDTKIDAKEVTSADELDRIYGAIGIEDGESYDLKLYSNTLGQYVTKLENGKFLVSIPLKDKTKPVTFAFYVDKDGNTTAYEVTVKDGVAQFETDHFSVYTLAYDAGTPGIAYVDTSKVFTDVKEGEWYKYYVDNMYSQGFMVGASKTEFGVNDTLTRAMFVTVLSRIAGVDQKAAAAEVFADVKAGEYYSKAVEWAKKNGVVAGYDDGTFRPNDSITREEICQMVVNYVNLEKITLNTDKGAGVFADAAEISGWAKAAVTACYKAGIVVGYKNGDKAYFKPQSTATRAEASVILSQFYDNYKA